MFKRPFYLWPLLAMASSSLQAAVPPSENIFPETTQGWTSAPDFQVLLGEFNKTQYGILLNDDVMKLFVEDFNRDTKKSRDKNPDSLPLTFDDLKEIAGGEVAVGIVDPVDRVPVQVLTVDVAGKEDAAKMKLDSLFADLKKEGAKESAITEAGQRITIYKKNEKVRWVHFQLGTLLCVTRDAEVARDVLNRALNGGTQSLAKFQPFVKVKQRLEEDRRERAERKDPDANTYQARWFVQPIGFMAAQEAMAAEKERGGITSKKKKQSQVEVLQKTGFDAIKGAGGTVTLHGKSYDIVHHTAVYAPKPWDLSMNCLSLVNQPQGLDPPDWLTDDVATFTGFAAEGLTAFDNYCPLFNVRVEREGKNRDGAWESALKGFRMAPPNGQGVDLRIEIVERLVREQADDPKAPPISRVYLVTDNKPPPITGDSERRLMAIEIYGKSGENPQQGTEKVKAALEKIFKSSLVPPDHTAKRHATLVPGVIIFEMLPDKNKVKEEPPNVVGVEAIGAKPRKPPAPKSENEAICVAHGYLLHASHISLLVKVLKNAEEANMATRPKLLANHPDYKQVRDFLDKECSERGWTDSCLRRFMFSYEEFKQPYELARQGILHESNSTLARMIRNSPGYSAKGQWFEGGRLPPYEATKSYLLPGGAVTRYEGEGWFIIGLTMHAGL